MSERVRCKECGRFVSNDVSKMISLEREVSSLREELRQRVCTVDCLREKCDVLVSENMNLRAEVDRLMNRSFIERVFNK